MEKNIFVISTILLRIVCNQANQIDKSMYANNSAYKALDDINK